MTENFVGTSNIFAKSFSKDKTYISNHATSPQLDIQINNQILFDDKIKPQAANNPFGFCQECAYHCIRKKRFMRDCRKFACYCDYSKYNQRICTWWDMFWCVNH
ncbi:hypothetical protein N665_0453s0035 [Sinapis alba]|nr:hypothetical protein N665_0453s0035 [Sinapis alba]